MSQRVDARPHSGTQTSDPYHIQGGLIAVHGVHLSRSGECRCESEGEIMWDTILWIAAIIIGVFGVMRIIQRDFLYGIVLIVVALLVGPGGVSVFS